MQASIAAMTFWWHSSLIKMTFITEGRNSKKN